MRHLAERHMYGSGPVPEEPDMIAIQSALLDADQVQLLSLLGLAERAKLGAPASSVQRLSVQLASLPAGSRCLR